MEKASPRVRWQQGDKGLETTARAKAFNTSSWEMVTPRPFRTKDMIRVSSRKLYRVMIRYVAPVMMRVLFLQPTGILS